MHDVFDIRRLYPSASFAHHMRTFAVEFGHDPALKDIDHLEADIVTMPDGHLIGARRDHADHMSLCDAAGRFGKAKIAIFRIRAQAAALEILLAQMRDMKALCFDSHDAVPPN